MVKYKTVTSDGSQRYSLFVVSCLGVPGLAFARTAVSGAWRS